LKNVAIPICKKASCGGVIKPDITFFGEKLSTNVADKIAQDRLKVMIFKLHLFSNSSKISLCLKVDALIVIGTSLKVAPVADIPGFIPHGIPQILINKQSVKPKSSISEGFDVELLGECDSIVEHLHKMLEF